MATRIAHASRVETKTAPHPPQPSLGGTVGLLVAADVLGLAVAVVAAAAVASAPAGGAGVPPSLGLIALGAFAVTPLAYRFADLYPASGMNRADELRHLTLHTGAVWLMVAAAAAVVIGGVGIAAAAAGWAVALFSVPLSRALARHAFSQRPWYGVPVVVLGAGEATAELLRRLQRDAGNPYRPVAVLDDDPTRSDGVLQGVPVAGPLTDAAAFAARGVRHALVVTPAWQRGIPLPAVQRALAPFPHVIMLPDLAGVPSVGVSSADLAGAVGLHVQQRRLQWPSLAAKRALDLAIAVPVALLAAPAVLLAALAVWLASPTNPFFSHEREGLGGRSFRMWKLRTMYPDAAARLERHLAADPDAAREWATRFKLARDPRILPGIGRLLRVTSLDELPQLWNVIRGDMSLVGPRPFPRYHLEAFGGEFRELRATVRPGLTGLWQVTARADADLALQEELDTRYVVNWSVWLDVYLLARTPWAVLRGGGAY